MRQDPDIADGRWIRDLETAEGAIKAAQTGHMVFINLAYQLSARNLNASAEYRHWRLFRSLTHQSVWLIAGRAIARTSPV